MAKILENDKKFKVIVLSQREARQLDFGIPEGFICMNCDELIEGELYYIAVLNDVMCKECYTEWYNRAKNYVEDAKIENRNFEYYKNLLGL